VLKVMSDMPDGVLGIEGTGEITADDYKQVLVPAVEQARAGDKKIRMLYYLPAEFESYSGGAIWQDARVGVGHLLSFEKVAVVTDVGWVAHSVNAFRWMMPASVKVFSVGELDDAKTWVAS